MIWSESRAVVEVTCGVALPGEAVAESCTCGLPEEGDKTTGAAEPGIGMPGAGVSKPVRASAAASSGVAAVVAACEAPAICCNCEATGWVAGAAAGGCGGAVGWPEATGAAGCGGAAAPPPGGVFFAAFAAASIRRCCSAGGRLSILVAISASCCGVMLRGSMMPAPGSAVGLTPGLAGTSVGLGTGGAPPSPTFRLSAGSFGAALVDPEPGPLV